MSKTVKEIWAARNNILNGALNSFFRKSYIESIALKRLKACDACENIDKKGTKCFVPGTQPCCALCGCKLAWKARCLSERCDIGVWEAVLTDEEELKLKDELGIKDEE